MATSFGPSVSQFNAPRAVSRFARRSAPAAAAVISAETAAGSSSGPSQPMP